MPLSGTTVGNRPLQLATLIMLRSNTKTSPNLLLGSGYGEGAGGEGRRGGGVSSIHDDFPFKILSSNVLIARTPAAVSESLRTEAERS